MNTKNTIPRAEELLARIQNYLEAGGLFNPEMMEHDKVRELIVDCREVIEHQQKLIEHPWRI